MNLKERTYEQIKERIISGQYAPGQLLNEKEIIEELKISRTPFREAVTALSKENLVVIYPNRGMFVREFSVKDVIEIYDVRYLIEPSIIQLAFGRIPTEVLSQLAEQAQAALSADIDTMLQEDDNFHMTTLKYVDNKIMVQIMERIYEYSRIRTLRSNRVLSVESSLIEHQKIIRCLINGKVDDAVEATKEHLIASRKRAIGLVF